MIGAIVGDIVGSVYEWSNIKTKAFPLFRHDSLGGDSDTMACITGAIAEAHYGVPAPIRQHALDRLDSRLRAITLRFVDQYVS